MNVKDINTKNWQLSLQNGGVVMDNDDIRQCIGTILLTRKGSVPLRPNFGSNIFDYVDKPLDVAIPAIKKEILDAISLYEPRITITKIIAEQIIDE